MVQCVSDLAVPTIFMAPRVSSLHARNMLLDAVFLPRKDQTCIGQMSVGVAGVLASEPLRSSTASR